MRNWLGTVVFLGLLLVAGSAFGQCNWQAIPGAPVAARIDDIFFLDQDMGWAVTSSGEIHYTDDGGATWDMQLQNFDYFRAVGFASPTRGWAGTLNPSSFLYETDDGGATWTVVTGWVPPRPFRICGISVADANTVYGCGAYNMPARWIKTTDGGTTWNSFEMSPQAETLVDVHFFDANHGFMVGGKDGTFPSVKPVVLETIDGGATWQERWAGTVVGEWGWKIHFVNPSVGFVSLENFSDAAILKTIDGGQTWQRYDVANNDDIQGVGFINETEGWVGGWGTTSLTTDGGLTWQPAAWGSALNRFRYISPDLSYASGTTIYKRDCTPTAVVPASYVSTSPFLLSSHPNPFNAQTTISYDLPRQGSVRVRIYDGLGRELFTLIDEVQDAGQHTVQWDGRDDHGAAVASGVYLYRVDALGRGESRSMVLVK